MTEICQKTVILKDDSRILLRRYNEEDYERLWKMLSTMSHESFRYQIRPTESFYKRWITDNKNVVFVGVYVKKTEKIVAEANLYTQGHKAYFGIYVHDDLQNLGLGTAFIKYIVGVAREMGLRKVFSEVAVQNRKIIHVCKKCGFEIEGLLRMEHEFHGELLDCYRIALLF